jgi:hypothetical protein
VEPSDARRDPDAEVARIGEVGPAPGLVGGFCCETAPPWSWPKDTDASKRRYFKEMISSVDRGRDDVFYFYI